MTAIASRKSSVKSETLEAHGSDPWASFFVRRDRVHHSGLLGVRACLYAPSMGTRIVDAWNGWFHINGNTYGTWMRGDPRGFRARHHREHIEGDYKRPPAPGTYDGLLAHALKRSAAPVHLSPSARRMACDAIAAYLQHRGVGVVACAVDDHHYHLLARFVLPEPLSEDLSRLLANTRHQPLYAYIRHLVGLAKAKSAGELSGAGLVPAGGVWGKRFKITPIADRTHQINVLRYIIRHARGGAAVWRFTRTECPPPPPPNTHRPPS